jgi:hypothetical protein
MIGFIGTSLQLKSIITAHNQWLPTIHSIPYWTTSVFSSTVTDVEINAHTTNNSSSLPSCYLATTEEYINIRIQQLFYRSVYSLPRERICRAVA